MAVWAFWVVQRDVLDIALWAVALEIRNAILAGSSDHESSHSMKGFSATEASSVVRTNA